MSETLVGKQPSRRVLRKKRSGLLLAVARTIKPKSIFYYLVRSISPSYSICFDCFPPPTNLKVVVVIIFIMNDYATTATAILDLHELLLGTSSSSIGGGKKKEEKKKKSHHGKHKTPPPPSSTSNNSIFMQHFRKTHNAANLLSPPLLFDQRRSASKLSTIGNNEGGTTKTKTASKTTTSRANAVQWLQQACPGDVLPKILAYAGPQTVAALMRTSKYFFEQIVGNQEESERTWKVLCEELYKVCATVCLCALMQAPPE